MKMAPSSVSSWAAGGAAVVRCLVAERFGYVHITLYILYTKMYVIFCRFSSAKITG